MCLFSLGRNNVTQKPLHAFNYLNLLILVFVLAIVIIFKFNF